MAYITDEEFQAKLAGIPDAEPKADRTRRRWRKNARHWQESQYHVPLDRNERARLLHAAEALEARTRQPGRQNGTVSRIGLIVLRCLMLQFLGRTGRCNPSYDSIIKRTGLCRQSVSNALKRLERAGLIRIMRRLKTEHVTRQCHITGNWQSFVTTVQDSNAYALGGTASGSEATAPAPTGRKSFPEPAGLFDWLDPSRAHRRKRPSSSYYSSDGMGKTARQTP